MKSRSVKYFKKRRLNRFFSKIIPLVDKYQLAQFKMQMLLKRNASIDVTHLFEQLEISEKQISNLINP